MMMMMMNEDAHDSLRTVLETSSWKDLLGDMAA